MEKQDPKANGWHERQLEFIELIHQPGPEAGFPETLLAGLQSLIGFTSAFFIPINTGTLELQMGYCLGCPAQNLELYLRDYAGSDPFFLNSPYPEHLNEAISLSATAESEQLAEGPLHEFMQKVPYRHELSIMLAFRGEPLALIKLLRQADEEDFDGNDAETLNRLSYHLAASLFLMANLNHKSPLSDLGILAFTEDCKILYMNLKARELLSGGSAENICQLFSNGVRLVEFDDKCYRLSTLEARPRCFLFLGQEKKGLRRRLNSTAKILVIDAFKRRTGLVKRMHFHGLSKREVEIATHVLRGLDNNSIAEQLNIDIKTVKTHLDHAFKKLRVKSRTELIAKILGLSDELKCGYTTKK